MRNRLGEVGAGQHPGMQQHCPLPRQSVSLFLGRLRVACLEGRPRAMWVRPPPSLYKRFKSLPRTTALRSQQETEGSAPYRPWHRTGTLYMPVTGIFFVLLDRVFPCWSLHSCCPLLLE